MQIEEKTKTGITELKGKTTELSNLIKEIIKIVPYHDSILKDGLLNASMSLTDLLNILEYYA